MILNKGKNSCCRTLSFASAQAAQEQGKDLHRVSDATFDSLKLCGMGGLK